ncbi:uncharacterized protein LOC111488793 isoform X1 [Cucurbita maxima]|uniref:Uncharacterized protein LOC111488793 isoform X1 n=1 Tax=Cucurbita maxima TaxID=3661 RepID=A0A6J1JZB1_CUCMA|nr:uncharacterized protein LOC111488793 isoform X1 [Cucurbita maxima]
MIDRASPRHPYTGGMIDLKTEEFQAYSPPVKSGQLKRINPNISGIINNASLILHLNQPLPIQMAPIKSLISIALLALLLLFERLPISAADHGVAPSPLAGVFRLDTLQTAERHQVAENGIGNQYSFEQKIRRRARRAVRRAEGPSPSSANWSRTSSFGVGSLLCLCTVFGLFL